jgi:transposase
MRGDDPQQAAMFSYLSPEERVPPDHLLRLIRAMVDAVLKDLSPQFDLLDSHTGRPSIAPEEWLRARLLQVLYTIRSERLLREQLDYNLLFRWFVGLTMDDSVWDPLTFSKNRERWLERDVARAFFDQVLGQARERELLSDEHFTVDGTLIEAWAGQKSFKRKAPDTPPSPPDEPGNPSINFRCERCTNAPHASTTDPEARLYKKTKGQEAKLAYLGHVLVENRHGLVVDTRVTQATGTAEREAALAMAEAIPGQQRVTLGADKNDDTRDFVGELRELRVTPQVAQHTSGRSSAIAGRTTRHPGYTVRQRKRTCIEEIFGWMKTVGLLRKPRHRGMARVGWMFTCAAAVYNLGRMRTLAAVVCAPRKAEGQGHLFPSPPLPNLRAQPLVTFQRSSPSTSKNFCWDHY